MASFPAARPPAGLFVARDLSEMKPFEEQRLYKFTLSSTYSIYPSFFLSSVDSPLTPHDSLSYAGSQAKSSLKIGWNLCDFKSQPLL